MKMKFTRLFLSAAAIFSMLAAAGCQRPGEKTSAPAALRDVAALKLNFRFEPDVPEPAAANKPAPLEERNAAVQSDFDANRTREALDKTIASPDKQSVLAVYHRPEDAPAEYRLDMYAADGKLLRKITPDSMAVHSLNSIAWSPDSSTVAFAAMTRAGGGQSMPAETAPTPPVVNSGETNANSDGSANVNANANTETNAGNIAAPTATPASQILTFRTDQIYSAARDGSNLKSLTQNEGLIYFYFVWSPDSASLAALAATWREWQLGLAQADQKGEIFIQSGRPRLVEKNGRIRILDDNVTAVAPVWSPDSSKIALAFDKEIRIYDAIGDRPTQAAIPLRNQLLLSSKIYDDNKRREMSGTNANANSNANANTNTDVNANANANLKTNANANANINANMNSASTDSTTSSLPDENMLVSFNPIIKLIWAEDSLLYLQTGYVKEMKDSANSAHSYLRWHRLVFSPQPSAAN